MSCEIFLTGYYVRCIYMILVFKNFFFIFSSLSLDVTSYAHSYGIMK